MRTTTKLTAVIGTAAFAVATTGVAYAYWSSSGTGTGSATTGTSSAFVVTSDAPTGGPLTPGGPSQTVAVHVNNPSTGVQRLASVVASVANADGSAWTAVTGCSAADYSVSAVTITTGDVAAGATVNGSFTVSMNNLSSNQDACENVTVPLHISAS